MIFERIKSSADSLTPTEQKLIRELLARPRDAALGTAGELARRIGVHEATASRLAKKLGFDSYAGFRDALREEFIVKTDPALRVKKTLSSASGTSLLGDLVEQEVAALAGIASFVTAEGLTDCARVLSQARKVFVFARGNAEALSVMADRRLRRMGIDTVILSGDARDLVERMAAMEEGDAVLAFAFRRAPRHWAILAEHADASRVPVVMIADTLAPSLVPPPAHLLFAPRSGSEDAFQTLLVPMTIANALILQVAQFDEKRSMERLERVGNLLTRLDGR